MISERISDVYLPRLNFEYGYPHINALLQFRLKFERCKPHNPTKYDVTNEVKQ